MARLRWFTRRRLALLLTVIAIPLAVYFAAPLFVNIQADVPTPTGFTVLAKQGTWQGADDFHFASGVAKILGDGNGNYMFRVEDFGIRNGPDIEFFLSENPAYDSSDVRLGDVVATSGNFNIPVPTGTDVDSANYAIVWCVPFGVLFATVALT